MGDANLFMADDYARSQGGRFVPVAHEGSAVLAAMGYAQISGEVGAATVTHGPALTNCVSALVEGVKGGFPIVLLAGDTPVARPEHHQNIDQRALVNTTGAGFEQVRAPATASTDVARAFYRARVERRPIVLNMPVDFMWELSEDTASPIPVYSEPRGAAQSDILDEAIGMIASARRPLILAGGGALHAGDVLMKLADRLEAPLAHSLKGKGLFQDHAYNIGFFGTLSSPAAYDVMAQADCIVAFGTSLNFYTTDYGKLMEGKRVIHVDIEPSHIGGSRYPEAAIVADAGAAAETILYWLDEAEIAPSGFTRDLDPAQLRHYPVPPNKTPDGFVNYVEALEALNATLPKDRIFVADVGRFMLEAWVRIDVPDARSFIPVTNFTCIGLGLQTALGACAAAPERSVVAFCGDGGFMMGGLTELYSAVSQGLDLTVVVANDRAYGAEHIQFAARDMDPSASHLDWPGFADVARSMGAEAIKVDSSASLEAACAAIRARSGARKGPLLIELCRKPDDMPAVRK